MNKKSKWVKIGMCAVDSGTIMLVDPCYVLPDSINKKGKLESHHGKDSYTYEKLMSEIFEGEKDLLPKQICFSGIGGTGVVTGSGFGDGNYPVYALISDEGDWGKRVKEVKIKFF